MHPAIASADSAFKRPRKRHILAFKPDEAVPRRFGCSILTVRCRQIEHPGKIGCLSRAGGSVGETLCFPGINEGSQGEPRLALARLLLAKSVPAGLAATVARGFLRGILVLER